MGRPNRLRAIEAEWGRPLSEIIPELVNKGGQRLAAIELGVSQSAVSQWLTANGYRKVQRWEKEVNLRN
jgi:predicted transcriptional regulator